MHIKRGFTVIELLIVIVIIGILAAFSLVSYSGVQTKANTAKRDADIATYFKAILMARENTGKTLGQITNNYWSAGFCMASPGANLSNVEPKNLAKSTSCWTVYYDNLNKIQAASGVSLEGLKAGDGNGNPYVLDENEGETVSCSVDVMYYFKADGTAGINQAKIVPRFTNC